MSGLVLSQKAYVGHPLDRFGEAAEDLVNPRRCGCERFCARGVSANRKTWGLRPHSRQAGLSLSSAAQIADKHRFGGVLTPERAAGPKVSSFQASTLSRPSLSFRCVAKVACTNRSSLLMGGSAMFSGPRRS